VAAAVLLEAEDAARARSARILARIEQVLEWRGEAGPALAALRTPRDRGGPGAEVILARASEAMSRVVEQTAWRACRRVPCAPALGESEALGAVAVAVAAGRIGAGLATEALVLGMAQGRGYAMVLTAP
jgi:hypothetical protein